jgi:DUF1365 family protein
VIPEPGLYVGTLRHRRFTPRRHAFTYELFMALLDIDRLPELMRVSRVTGYNRWNWATFDERDHFGDPAQPLRDRVRASARAAGIALTDGPIYLLTHLRYAGHVFNPISLFYCYDATGSLAHVLAEVNNTYGGRQLYWLTDEPVAGRPSFHARAEKQLYVSPFMDVEVDYEFALTPPGASLVAHMDVRHGSAEARGRSPRDAVAFDATLSLRHQPWTASVVRSALVRFPLMTTRVVAAIHWQALRLYLKGVPVVPRLVANGEGERAANRRRQQPAAVPGVPATTSREDWR